MVTQTTPAITQGEGSEPVGWQYRYRQASISTREPEWSSWTFAGTEAGARYNASGMAKEYEIRPLYASPPPLPVGNADPRVREALEKVRRWFKGRLQGKPVGDPGNALADLDQAIAALPSPQSQGLVEAAEGLSNFAWSAIKADCDEARDHLNELLAGLRTELALVRASDRSA